MKSGIDYFPLDVTLDAKFELIEAEFGLTGFGVVVHLLQEIYGKAGYYIEWIEEVALLFARKIGLGGGVVSEIVEASIRRGMFDKEKYDKYHVLTSKGIQKRYFEAVSRRKVLEVDFNILLVNVAQICPSADIRAKNVNITSENDNISEQSKVEKSKVEKSKVKDICARDSAFESFWAAYPRKVGKQAAQKAFAKVSVPIETLIAAVNRQKKSDQWSKDGGRYIPNPATWLNQGRWEDDLPESESPSQVKRDPSKMRDAIAAYLDW